jgi:hypothetical protein
MEIRWDRIEEESDEGLEKKGGEERTSKACLGLHPMSWRVLWRRDRV